MTTVYVMRAKGTNLVKIGFTAGPVEERRRALQTGCPHELVVELSFEGTVEDERRAHSIHRDRRLVGEWFDLAVDLVRGIPSAVDKAREWDEVQSSHGDVSALVDRFGKTFGRGHFDELGEVSTDAIELFCKTVSAHAYDPRMNGSSNICRRCQVATPPLDLGPMDADEICDAVIGENDENLGHARGCPVPWLARAAKEIRRGRG